MTARSIGRLRPPPMSGPDKEKLEATLHGAVMDLQMTHSLVRFAFGVQMGERMRRIIGSVQALLEDIERRPPDTSHREEPCA